MQVVSNAIGNCNDLDIVGAPQVEVISSQRCPAALSRGVYLRAVGLSGQTAYCGATNFTYEFTSVTGGTSACTDGTVNGLPTLYTTVSSSPFLQLNVLPAGIATGSWNVRIRANFSYGSSEWGPSRRIIVTGVAGAMMFEEETAQSEERSYENESVASIYPNPSNGSSLVVNYTDLTGNQVQVRIMDATGREIFRSAYSVDGSFNQMLTFSQPLAAGMYMVEMTDGSRVVSERMIVKN